MCLPLRSYLFLQTLHLQGVGWIRFFGISPSPHARSARVRSSRASRPSPSRSASAPARRSSASSTACCCGRFPTATPIGSCWCGRSSARATCWTSRSRSPTSAIFATARRRSTASPAITGAGRTAVVRRQRRARAGSSPRARQANLFACSACAWRSAATSSTTTGRRSRNRRQRRPAPPPLRRSRARRRCRPSRSSVTGCGSDATAATRASSGGRSTFGQSTRADRRRAAAGFRAAVSAAHGHRSERRHLVRDADQLRHRRAQHRRAVRVIARMKPGVTLAQAQADADGIAATLREQFPPKKNVGPALPRRRHAHGSRQRRAAARCSRSSARSCSCC